MALREILASFGFAIDDSGLKKANAGIDGVVSKLTNLKGVLAGALGALGIGALKGQIDELASESGELNKAAIKAGVGFEQFQKLQYQTGLGTDQLSLLFRKLQQNMAAAGGAAEQASSDFGDVDGGLGKVLGKKQASETFDQLGIKLKDAGGQARSSADVFQDTAKALAGLPTPAEKTAVAMRLFGRSGADILPFLQKSPEAIQALGEQFDAIGGFSEDNRKALAAYGKEQKALDLASKSLKITLLTAIVPAFTFLFGKLNEGITWFKKHVDTSQLVTVGLGFLTLAVTRFGIASAAASAKALAGWLRVAAPIAILYLLIDDLIHFLKGDANTAIQALIDSIFGIEAGSEIAADLRSSFYLWTLELNKAKGILETIKTLVTGILEGLAKITSPATWSKGSKTVAAETSTAEDQANFNKISAGKRTEGLGTRITQSIGDFLSGTKTTQGPITVPIPPNVPLLGGGKTPAGPTTVTNTTSITQNISGADAQDVADQSVAGIKKAQEKDRRATLNAVEARK